MHAPFGIFCLYTDPGTGALIWQALVGGFIGSMFYLHHFITWLKHKRNSSKRLT